MTIRRWWRLAAVAMVLVLSTAGAASGLLADLAGHWSAPLIAALEAKGIVSGDAPGRYDPEAPLTRAQLAKLVVVSRGNGADAALLSGLPSRFTDVPSWHWAKGFIESLAETGITEGYPDGSFHPGDLVSRAQMAVFVRRTAGLDPGKIQPGQLTRFRDDNQIPGWAWSSVYAAATAGLITGYIDGSFQPNLPITRGEAGAIILRLTEYMGDAYHLAGTLVQFDVTTGKATVRDGAGVERTVAMKPEAQYFRTGLPAGPLAVRRYDQVWIIRDAQGQGRFMEARSESVVGTSPAVSGKMLSFTSTQGVRRSMAIQPGALLFLNGRPTSPAEIAGADSLYALVDTTTNELRVVDGIRVPIQGELLGIALADNSMGYLDRTSDEPRSLQIGKDALLFLNGEPVALDQLNPGDRIRAATGPDGRITYLQAER